MVSGKPCSVSVSRMIRGIGKAILCGLHRSTKSWRKLKATPFIFNEKGVLQFDADKAVNALDLKGKLGLSENNEVPPLTLVRADGTTLYTTRDIAYTMWKFKHAQKVINVIGMEQSLAQLQLKLALYAMGYGKDADNLVHFAYNLVTLPGYKMSSRRGHYITFDEVLTKQSDALTKRFPSVHQCFLKKKNATSPTSSV